ncbi:hypothetical protein [Natronoflexus pectinivorans]|uniref:AhpC/TSA family protein n=1 Tax=Natronoflexus pectinivorans TaxID=682526 RepID=A0A4R2G946_9BACT|nr:hypothetical protein [Natronoflexus pectinivorans]TCO04415.1 hypothetical protein EV194_1184 [Natronoflexus pectinivorans]
MRLNIIFIIVVYLFTISSCTQPSQTEKELREVLNSHLNIEMFESLLHKDSTISYKQFREAHSYLSVIYLQDGCSPCYPKFVEWHQKMEEMEDVPGHTLLFIIQTDEYDTFLHKVNELDQNIDKKYYIIVDPDHKLFISNNQIPSWIMNSSMLIDEENKIKMVGAPWVNEDMKNLFYKTVSSD